MVELVDTYCRRLAFRVLEGKVIGLSFSPGSTCEMTPPVQYGDASVASTICYKVERPETYIL